MLKFSTELGFCQSKNITFTESIALYLYVRYTVPGNDSKKLKRKRLINTTDIVQNSISVTKCCIL